jgi:RNA polymerase sigma-70 factor (ECF subfamily)
VVTKVAVDSRIVAATVAEAARGDADALAWIVGAHHDDMARIAFVICGDQDRAQDAAQNAWTIAWRKLGSLRDPDSLRPWLMSIAVNEARQLMRRERRHPVTEIAAADIESGGIDPGARAGAVDLASALRRLSTEDRAILALRHVAGFDATEIGRAVGMSPSGVRTRLARLLARLRSELDHD